MPSISPKRAKKIIKIPAAISSMAVLQMNSCLMHLTFAQKVCSNDLTLQMTRLAEFAQTCISRNRANHDYFVVPDKLRANF